MRCESFGPLIVLAASGYAIVQALAAPEAAREPSKRKPQHFKNACCHRFVMRRDTVRSAAHDAAESVRDVSLSTAMAAESAANAIGDGAVA